MDLYTRRQFLVGSSLAATAILSPTCRVSAATAPSAPPPRVLVDWHSHYASAAEVRFFAARGQAPHIVTGPDGIARLQNVDTASAAAGSPTAFSASDLPARIRHLEQNGIRRQLLTQTVAWMPPYRSTSCVPCFVPITMNSQA